MKILLVEDHAIVREGFRRILSEDITGACIGEAASSAEALDRVRAEAWDVVILDISLPGRSGLETLKDIHALRSGLPVLIMTMYGEDQYALRAFRAGAAGYVTKGSSPEDLVAAVQKVASGGKYVTPTVAEKLAARLSDDGGRPLHESLSDRELQVLRMFGDGKTVKEIGVDLALSVKTVSTYRTRILEKMGMRTTAQLVRYAVGAGLVD
ncbi:MAG: response regulator with a DNA-binding domain [Labilithrix sp.]|nr:response regulator with a DNA-binding domain [Labilithrix sp.]